MMDAKMIIVVDESINPHDVKAVAKQVFESIDMTRDLVFSEGPLDALDHASAQDHYGYRLGVDATKKFEVERKEVKWNYKLKESKALNDYLLNNENIASFNYPIKDVLQGALIVSIKKKNPNDAKKIINELWAHEDMKYNKLLIIVDEDVDANDVSKAAWKVFNNIDAKRDLVVSEVNLEDNNFGHH